MFERSNKAQGQFVRIVEYVHYAGRKRDALTGAERYAIYCEGDGFGHLPESELLEINDGWDWSHIRDSSDEGIQRMSDKLDEILSKKEVAA